MGKSSTEAVVDLDLETEGRLVFLVDSDPVSRTDLEQQISYNGYRVLSFRTMADVMEAADNIYPNVIVANVAFPEDDTIMAVAEIYHMRSDPVPIIFVSENQGIDTRLKAVRFGGRAYLTKPVDRNQLVGLLNDLSRKIELDPYRILILQKDREMAVHYRNTLEEAGMRVQILDNPMDVLDAITEFQPELIMLNLYYPDCLGMELSAVIRQNDLHQGISIVFMSDETRLDPQMAALRTGGDAFMPHSITPNCLITSISVRVDRSRILNSLMVKDSLTGLLNHTNTRETLNEWARRASRNSFVFSFAMVDMDLFKKINDVHGHQAGDRVIQSLARTLSLHVREKDVVGRYGGEEFAILFYGLHGEEARNILNKIRRDFSRIRQRSDVGDFFVTFSSGLADCLSYEDPHYLNDAADRGLFAAKRAGRNRVAHIQKKRISADSESQT